MPPDIRPDVADVQLDIVDEWIGKAGDALLGLYVPGRSGFLRTTMPGDVEAAERAQATPSPAPSGGGRDGISSAATYRALFALVEWRRCRREDGADFAAIDDRIVGVFGEWVLPPLLSSKRLQTLREQRSDGEASDFIDGQLLLAAAAMGRLPPSLQKRVKAAVGPELSAVSLANGVSRLAEELWARLNARGGGVAGPQSPGVHDFVTLHAVRGVDAYAATFLEQRQPLPSPKPETGAGSPGRALRDQVYDRVLGQLAYESAEVFSRFDPAELLLAAALLGRFRTDEWQLLVRRAVLTVIGSQTDDGAWPNLRVVAYAARRLLDLPSYELSLTLADIVYRDLSDRQNTCDTAAMESLEKTLGLVRAGYRVVATDGGTPRRGWANDRTRGGRVIETWSTAIVLTFLLRYREVLRTARQENVLRRYKAVPGRAPKLWEWDWQPWPELASLLREPRLAEPDALIAWSDPSPGRELVAALERRIVCPAGTGEVGRPARSGTALILYGKPGTRKTTLTKLVGKTLGWPVVTLSPPNFLSDGGLDGFEAAAERVFTDLMRLRRCVVLFDECEDFFKPRKRRPFKKTTSAPGPSGGEGRAVDQERDDESDTAKASGVRNEALDDGRGLGQGDPDEPGVDERSDSRTIGAFLTAGMLPRLQALHDQRWVIFVLATNIGDLRQLDEAVIRSGRFDLAQRIDHPGLEEQLDYVDKHRERALEEEDRKVLKDALTSRQQRVRARPRSAPPVVPLDVDVSDVPYAVIDELVREIVDKTCPREQDAMIKRLDNALKRDGPPPLYEPLSTEVPTS